MPGLKALLEERCAERAMDCARAAIAISRIPYGRPSRLTPDAVVDEWRGTCSTKHLLFAEIVADSWPELAPELWHRPYVVTREFASAQWGHEIVDLVPVAGLVDVHTFATINVDGRRVFVDVTFPLSSWEGASDIALACGEGTDVRAGDEPLVSKARLVAQYCDASSREPFIAALSQVMRRSGFDA